MAIKTVEWTSFTRLSCAGCAPSDVFICTSFDVVIPGQMISFQQFNNGCGQKFYRYTFTYDTADLPEGVTGITCANITGVFCQGCLTTWVEQEIAGATADVAGLQTQIDALVLVDADLQVQIDLIDANPKAEVFGAQSYLQAYSFLLNPGTPVDVDLVVTNPSAVNSMAVNATFGWDLSLVSSTTYGPTGASSQLFQDAVLVPNSDRDASENWTPAGIRAVNFTAGTGEHHFILGPGASTTLTLRISEAGGTPDTSWSAEHIYVSAFGVTI